MNLVDRIRELCQRNDLSLTKLEVILGFGNGTIGRWKTASPTYDKLKAVADYFGVSPEYLAEGKEKSSPPSGSELSEKEWEFMNMLRGLCAQEQDMLMAQMSGLRARAERDPDSAE